MARWMGDGTNPLPGYYDIVAQQDSTFTFHVEYYDDASNPIDLSESILRFDVRPNYSSNTLFLSTTTNGVTVGGLTGEFINTTGIRGTGGISLNCAPDGSGLTGGILVSVDYHSMGFVRAGNWKYSLDVVNGERVEEILAGQFTVLPKVTR